MTDANLRRAVELLTKRIAEQDRRLAKVERAHPLQSAVIDRGALAVAGEDGAIAMTIGPGADGTVVPRFPAGPVPHTPTAPGLTAGVGTVTVSWDGQTVAGPAPDDFAHLVLYFSTEADFEPSAANAMGAITTKGGSKTLGVPPGTWQVRTAIRTLAVQESEPTAPVEVEVPSVVEDDGFREQMETVQEGLAATVLAQGNRGGTHEPTAADAEGAAEGVVYYQRETVDGPAVAIWQWRGAAWSRMPLADGVFAYLTTDKLVAGESLIDGVLIEDGTITSRHVTAESFQGHTFKGVLFEGSEMRAGTLIGNNISGGYVGTANIGRRVYMQGDSLTAKGADEQTSLIVSPSGISLTKPGEGLVELGPHIYGSYESGLRGTFRHTNNLLPGQNTTSTELWDREAADQQAVSDRYKVEVAFSYAAGTPWSTDPDHPRAQVYIQAVDAATLQPIANLFARDILLHGLGSEATYSFAAFGSGSLGGFRGRFHLRRITTVRSVPSVLFRDFTIHVTPF